MSADGELAVRLHHVRIGRTLSGMCQEHGQCILVCSQHLLLSFGFSEASDKVTTKQSEVSEDQTEMITDASKDLSTDTSTDAQVTEKIVQRIQVRHRLHTVQIWLLIPICQHR